MFANSLFFRHLHGRSPANFAFRNGLLLVLPAPSVSCRSRLDLSEDRVQGLFERPGLPISPAAGPVGQAMSELHDEARGAVGIRGLRELLPDTDGVREAVDSNVHSTLAWVEERVGLPHLVPSPDRLSRQSLQQKKRPSAEHRRHDESALVAFLTQQHRRTPSDLRMRWA
ncbi:hypothetical protein ACFYQ5_18965 [Streptomyces sp. NPDC005794]|uniref:hypothetical protein n=1 Tax=Streptomyces sp. NPDC005794 TaxID=3364733 RepID=UPI00369C599D